MTAMRFSTAVGVLMVLPRIPLAAGASQKGAVNWYDVPMWHMAQSFSFPGKTTVLKSVTPIVIPFVRNPPLSACPAWMAWIILLKSIDSSGLAAAGRWAKSVAFGLWQSTHISI